MGRDVKCLGMWIGKPLYPLHWIFIWGVVGIIEDIIYTITIGFVSPGWRLHLMINWSLRAARKNKPKEEKEKNLLERAWQIKYEDWSYVLFEDSSCPWDAIEAAEEAASIAYNEWWDVVDYGTSLTFTVTSPKGEVSEVTVEIDYNPEFYGHEVKGP